MITDKQLKYLVQHDIVVFKNLMGVESIEARVEWNGGKMVCFFGTKPDTQHYEKMITLNFEEDKNLWFCAGSTLYNTDIFLIKSFKEMMKKFESVSEV